MLRQDRFASQTYNFYFHVFIVDHKAREGSEVEAAIVKDRITSMGRVTILIAVLYS